MLLIDLNQVLLSGLLVQIGPGKEVAIEENLVRHMVLNILRTHIKQFKKEYGEVVLCCDNRNYWRKGFFPYYKASRKKTREKSNLNWTAIFNILNILQKELRENFPYKVINVDGAEADDIIGTLVPLKLKDENILILSSDSDFLQLQMLNGETGNIVRQYNPAQKKYVKSKNPLMDLKEKIISGDKGDGIPNILSPSDCFVREMRQKSITKKHMHVLMNEDHDKWLDDTARSGFYRNETLIDLRLIPKHIQKSIVEAYQNTKPVPRSQIINFFMEKKLKNLMEVIEDY